MIAEDVMTTLPVTVGELTSIGEALSVLSEGDIRHLPVVRGSDVVGMLSDRDFRSLGVGLTHDLKSFDTLRARLAQPASSLMSGGVITVDRDADVTEVIQVMLDEKLSAVPVVETATTQLVGIISYLDLLAAAMPALLERS
jgi:acetoin utilization protein AcuB